MNLKSTEINIPHGSKNAIIKKTVSVGDNVIDDLTYKRAKVLEILCSDKGCVMLKLNNTYLEGFRYPWEITLDVGKSKRKLK